MGHHRPDSRRSRHDHRGRRDLRPAGHPDRLEPTAAAVGTESLGRAQDMATRHLVRFGGCAGCVLDLRVDAVMLPVRDEVTTARR
ncbi:hypothetical protein GCM10010260_37930 [Streptomyces filipinensis]|uniref:Uncharacterized protein n=1 Tax=Streptomyces filipinensis TaxID=66887 RepID=A0A918IC33_9ACTN|nr:hypothetical protein [Streptomyces filipinensis]GGU98172.1 hypothetical protein GCM10010260_37930 [Streptomyces filipinensis]